MTDFRNNKFSCVVTTVFGRCDKLSDVDGRTTRTGRKGKRWRKNDGGNGYKKKKLFLPRLKTNRVCAQVSSHKLRWRRCSTVCVCRSLCSVRGIGGESRGERDVTVNVGRRRSFALPALPASYSLFRRLPYISHSSTPPPSPRNLLPANPHRFNNSLSRTAVKTDTRCRVHATGLVPGFSIPLTVLREIRYAPPSSGLSIRVRTVYDVIRCDAGICRTTGSGVFDLKPCPHARARRFASRFSGKRRKTTWLAHDNTPERHVTNQHILSDIKFDNATRGYFLLLSLLICCTENPTHLMFSRPHGGIWKYVSFTSGRFIRPTTEPCIALPIVRHKCRHAMYTTVPCCSSKVIVFNGCVAD